MIPDTDDIIRPGYPQTRNGSQFVLVTIEEDIVYSDDEKRTKEDGSTEVPFTSVLIGSYVKPQTIDESEWNREMIKALKPMHWNKDELRIDQLTVDIRAAMKKRYEEDPHSEHIWNFVDEPTFMAYELESYDRMNEDPLKFKTRTMYCDNPEKSLVADGNKMDTSETKNFATDDGAAREYASDGYSETHLQP
jgi:hypothetical protein